MGLATACTQPMDVLKVRMQLEALVKGHRSIGMVRAADLLTNNSLILPQRLPFSALHPQLNSMDDSLAVRTQHVRRYIPRRADRVAEVA